MSNHLDSLDTLLNTIRDLNQDFYHSGVGSVRALPLLVELKSRFQESIADSRREDATSAGMRYGFAIDRAKSQIRDGLLG
jgi:hypothetical protein